MKKWILTTLVLTLLSASLFAAEKVKEREDGFFEQGHKKHADYIVDTKTQLCFFRKYRSVTLIPCSNLALREEWRKIITWVSSGK